MIRVFPQTFHPGGAAQGTPSLGDLGWPHLPAPRPPPLLAPVGGKPLTSFSPTHYPGTESSAPRATNCNTSQGDAKTCNIQLWNWVTSGIWCANPPPRCPLTSALQWSRRFASPCYVVQSGSWAAAALLQNFHGDSAAPRYTAGLFREYILQSHVVFLPHLSINIFRTSKQYFFICLVHAWKLDKIRLWKWCHVCTFRDRKSTAHATVYI